MQHDARRRDWLRIAVTAVTGAAALSGVTGAAVVTGLVADHGSLDSTTAARGNVRLGGGVVRLAASHHHHHHHHHVPSTGS